MKRRDFLKNSALLTAASSLPLKSLAQGSKWAATHLRDDMPIAKIADSQFNSMDFNGDDIDRPHDLLWNIDGYIAKKGGEPPVTEELDVAIIGGGMSGLISAHYLGNKKIAVLEGDQRFGGNSKGEQFKDSIYSIGAAYICEPEKDSAVEALLKDINVLHHGRLENGADTSVFHQGRIHKHFWAGATAPDAKPQYTQIFQRLNEIYNDSDWDWQGDFAKSIDNLSFEQWLQKEFGDVHDHIREYFQLYGWSSFCGSINEISAFQFLGFITAETESIMAFPGGNSFITQGLVRSLRQRHGHRVLRSGSFALRVEAHSDSVTVLYENNIGELIKVRAKHAIMACQKFVARRLIPQMSEQQGKAIQFLPYRAYLVGNAILAKNFKSPSYELFQLKGKMPKDPTAMNRGDRTFTDICFGSWAGQDRNKHSILSLYHGIPYDGARQFLFSPMSHDKYREKYEAELKTILPGIGISESDLLGMRLTRWGHSLPLSQKGLLSSGQAATASESILGRIHFANQDNWMNPCFETAQEVAEETTSLILEKI